MASRMEIRALGAWAGRMEPDQLEKVLQQDGRGLLAWARLLTGDTQDAEDVLQEALSKVAFVSLARVENLRAYLYKAVRNAALNLRRAQARRQGREETAPGPAFEVFQEPAARREEVQALNEAMACLPQEQREVVLMKVWGGLSFTEIAEAAGLPRDTAASRYRYALGALRMRMRKFCDE